MILQTLLLIFLLCHSVTSLRYVMYVDEWHSSNLPSTDVTSGITHAIMAFAKSETFNSGTQFTPWENVQDFKSRFPADTKFMVSIGGWGDLIGFSDAVKSNSSIQRYAKNVAAMLTSVNADGVDIDWEYPGGNGANYRDVPNSQKTDERNTFPLLLQEIKTAIGKEKILSIGVPGLQRDMIAYTPETAPGIFSAVDMVNIMSYDLMNRRDSVTKHHTSVTDSLQSVQNYLDLGLDPAKANLGFSFYAKYFSTGSNSNCTTMNALGCSIAPAESENGSDNHNSGSVTFESIFMEPQAPTNLSPSSNGACGPTKGRCPLGTCCSPNGYCGTTGDFCALGCISDYGNCSGPSLIASWRNAQKYSIADQNQGGKYYFDPSAQLFWTWDTAQLMQRKFTDIVDKLNIGGVMAWSLGEDSYDWSHVNVLKTQVGLRA